MSILAYAHNPGGANAIAPVLRKLIDEKKQVKVLSEYAATNIFRSKGIESDDVTDRQWNQIRSSYVTPETNLFLAGTSIGNTMDKYILSDCNRNSIPSIYVLDFWSNYMARFVMPPSQQADSLPRFLCVMDAVAKDEAIKDGFSENSIVVTGNPFFDHFTDQITSDHEDESVVLFISQPLKELQPLSETGYDEVEILENILTVIEALHIGCKVTVKIHPRERGDKYDQVIKNSSVPVNISQNESVEALVSNARVIIGINSMVLFQAALAGKEVISYQPFFDGTDYLPSNAWGLSHRVVSRDELDKILNSVFSTAHQSHTKRGDTQKNPQLEMIRQRKATDNVMQLINSLNVYGNK